MELGQPRCDRYLAKGGTLLLQITPGLHFIFRGELGILQYVFGLARSLLQLFPDGEFLLLFLHRFAGVRLEHLQQFFIVLQAELVKITQRIGGLRRSEVHFVQLFKSLSILLVELGSLAGPSLWQRYAIPLLLRLPSRLLAAVLAILAFLRCLGVSRWVRCEYFLFLVKSHDSWILLSSPLIALKNIE